MLPRAALIVLSAGLCPGIASCAGPQAPLPARAKPPRPWSATAAGEARFTGLLGRAWGIHEVCEAAAARGGGLSDSDAFKDLRARAHAHLAALLAVYNQAGFSSGELAQSEDDLADSYRRSAEALARFHDTGEEDRLRQEQARLKADLAALLSGSF
jgi:hypothetical protein